MTKLHLVSLCLIGLSTPALAQISLTLPTGSSTPLPTSASSGPSSTDMSVELDTSDEPSDVSADSAEPPAAPALASKDALAEFYKTCKTVSGGDPKGGDAATADGWVPDDQTDGGPYRKVYSASKDVAGYGSVTLWGSVDTYPSQMLGYCRVDFGDYDSLINLGDLTGTDGLAGTATTPDGSGNAYGAWESADHTMLVIADRTDGQVEIEFNFLLGAKK
jgi:hypothetical protein